MAEGWIDRYRLQELLSRGGMGEVWRAEDEVLDRTVAVKLLYEAVGDSPDTERFLREARAAARLTHPNIVATHDVGDWDGRPFLVMEYLTGPTLAEELEERGPLPVAEIRRIGAQIAAALAAAHEAGVVHRDLKPANLILTAGDEVKLIDFGLAWLLDEPGVRLTPDDTAMGTVTYLAPELATGSEADERSDLYSLGCVLYELACGRPPFQGSMAAIVLGHVNEEPEPPSTLRPDVPTDLEALILHLLGKSPEHRPPDAEQVRRRLLGVAGAASVTELEPVRIPQPRKEIAPRRMPAARFLIGGVVVAGIIGLLLWWALPGIGQGLPLAVPPEPATLSGPEAHEPVQAGRVPAPTPKPENSIARPDPALGLPKVKPSHQAQGADDGKDVPDRGGQPPGKSGVRRDDPPRKGQPVSLPADRGRPEDRNAAHNAGRRHAKR